MKKYLTTFLMFSLIFLVISSGAGCYQRPTKIYSLEELQKDLFCVELVRFSWKDGQEIEYKQLIELDLEGYEVYDIYKTLNQEETSQFIDDLSDIKFQQLYGPPKDLNGEGFILKYPDKVCYLDRGTILEIYNDESRYRLWHNQSSKVEELIAKYMSDVD